MKTRVFFCASLAAAALLAQEPTPAAGSQKTGKVSGKVVNAGSGDPMRRVTITLQKRNSPGAAIYTAESDSNGRFGWDDVAPGEYVLTAVRQGFMIKPSGAAGAPLPPVVVEAGASITDLAVPMVPLGIIAGRVVDEDGDPVRGAQVQAMSYVFVGGKRQLRTVIQVSANDKGEYRLWGLRPGTFYLQANARSNVPGVVFNPVTEQVRGLQLRGRAATFYPSTTDVTRAVPVEVAAGMQLRGMDIHLRREALQNVRGKLAPDVAGGGMFLQLVAADGNRATGAMSRTNDSFQLSGVLPGSYILKGFHMEGETRKYVSQPVEVGNEDVDLGVITFSAGLDIPGSIRIEGGKHDFKGQQIGLQPLSPGFFGVPSTEVKPDGSFLLHDVAPDIYQFNVPTVPGAYVKAILLNDHESPDHRVDLSRGSGQVTIVLATDAGQVEGVVHNAAGDPAPRIRVTLFPNNEHDTSRFAFTNEKGEYKILSVPPGDYKLYAWEDVAVGQPQDPDFRKQFEKKAIPLKLEPKAHGKADLPLITATEVQHPDQQ